MKRRTTPLYKNPATWLGGLIGCAVLVILWVAQPAAPRSGGKLVDVREPAQYSDRALVGRQAFNANCAVCHGTNAAGQDGVAPPLIHRIYEPGHHGDASFLRAVTNGVRAHHWPFGDMPAIRGLDREDVMLITAYIRELQHENGIF